ncbi:hypothetical protein PHET_05480 [Paragonimus heterotremus]|uniref:Uncharacterized protein n=1 Tax=Paragonimus heterotremus TaxID=100268 RepID=A0A8J4SP63_9TREM|nr:hypothetical protein PHET_05480 [Paragonimus heterotremus]
MHHFDMLPSNVTKQLGLWCFLFRSSRHFDLNIVPMMKDSHSGRRKGDRSEILIPRKFNHSLYTQTMCIVALHF